MPDVLHALTSSIRAHPARVGARPLLVALDGRSGAGKSTLAAQLATHLPNCTVLEGDTFYGAPNLEVWDALSIETRTGCVIDWARQRPVLMALRRRQPVAWHAYDWASFDGRLEAKLTHAEPADVIVLEGVYSARPELADLIDLRVLLDTDPGQRLAQLEAREGDTTANPWSIRWEDSEQHYFRNVMPPTAFDVVL